MSCRSIICQSWGFSSPPANHSNIVNYGYLTQVSQHSTWKLWSNFEHQRETSWVLPCYYGDTEFTAKADPWNQCCWRCWWPADQLSWSCCLPCVCDERSVHRFPQVEIHRAQGQRGNWYDYCVPDAFSSIRVLLFVIYFHLIIWLSSFYQLLTLFSGGALYPC